ncbi:hypothetical protein BDZ89DRAFT_1069574 [Hymenopellis radicata]|nr:hypothetical protein BDZ89DRAFT_1069574 [Hymenopellis radicata]
MALLDRAKQEKEYNRYFDKLANGRLEEGELEEDETEEDFSDEKVYKRKSPREMKRKVAELAQMFNVEGPQEMLEIWKQVNGIFGKSTRGPSTPKRKRGRTSSGSTQGQVSPKSPGRKKQKVLSPSPRVVRQRKRKASASPLQERPKKGEKTPEKRRFSKKSRFTLEEVGRRDELWVPYEVRRILEEGWKKPLRISMFTPEACLKEQNANLGEDVKHLKLNADGEMVATSKSSHSTDRVLGPGPWTASLSNMARAVDRYYVPLTDKDGEPLTVSAAQMAKEFDTLRQECMRHPNFEQDFEVFKRYVEWAFRVHFQYELQVDVSVRNKAQFDTIAIEVEKEHRRALKKEINELKELAEKRAKDNARGGPKAPSGPRASSSSGTSQKTQGSQKSGGQKRSGKTYPCIYDNSTSHDTFDCPGGSSLIVHVPEGRPNGSFVDKKTGKKYCISWNQGQSCTRSICASGNIFLHACAICRFTEHCSRDHGKS